jgi:hypothetical protein
MSSRSLRSASTDIEARFVPAISISLETANIAVVISVLPVSLCAGVHRNSVNSTKPNLITITISQFALAGSGQPRRNRLNNVLQRIPEGQPIRQLH